MSFLEVAYARTRFAEFLLSISDCPAYFFVISGGEEDQPSSLCKRCNLLRIEFDAFLIFCNLATSSSRSDTIVIKHGEWEKFIIEHGLSDTVQKIGRTEIDLHFLIHGRRSLARRTNYHTLRIGKNTTNSPNNIQGQVEKAAVGGKNRMRKRPVFTNLRALQRRFASDASLSIYNFIIDDNSLFDRVMTLLEVGIKGVNPKKTLTTL
jgi:hypothetical protein